MDFLTSSENISHEYCCSIVKTGRIVPIDGADFLGKTLVNGFQVVVRRETVHEGDVLVYCPIETALNTDFLAANNAFGIENRLLNANFSEVQRLIDRGQMQEAKRKVGFFGKNGRIKIVRLRGEISMGCLFPFEYFANWLGKDKTAGFDPEAHIGLDFDTVAGIPFAKAYVPPYGNRRIERANKRNKKLKKWSRLIPGEFTFHYDTEMLNREIKRIKPTDRVAISVKLHGASICIGNVKVKKPKQFRWSLLTRLYRLLPERWQKYDIDYDLVYSSRTIVKNADLNPRLNAGFYEADIWRDFHDLLLGKIEPGVEIFGEIVGYITGTTQLLQPGYDYGCAEGTNKMMPYRVAIKLPNGIRRELNMDEVRLWTIDLVSKYPELAERIMPLEILYCGTLRQLYPDIDVTNRWHADILAAMMADHKRLGMEENEPLCHHQVPREGIILRIQNDIKNEAFKLKTVRFLEMEAAKIDQGEVDLELQQGNY